MPDVPVKVTVVSCIAALGLAITLVPTLKAASPGDDDVLTQLLGGTREIASKAAFTEADVYFHGGVSGGCHHHDEDGCHDEDHGTKSQPTDLPLASIIEDIQVQTAPREHVHLSAAHQKEVLPWFVAAARLNPQSVDVWGTGAYWYYKTGESDEAQSFISEGIAANPGAYQLYLERGILEHRLFKWKEAISDLDTARCLWKGQSEDDKLNKKAIGIYLKDAKEHLTAAQRK
jgi:tetratricopeptide (TPR) repeat protein